MIDVTTGENTTLTKIEPGDFAAFRYRNSDNEHSSREVLVLGYDEDEELLHAMDLEGFTDANLVNTALAMSQVSSEVDEFRERFDEDGEVYIEIDEDQVERWYDTFYNPSVFEENPYRTFRSDRIRNLRRADANITTGGQ